MNRRRLLASVGQSALVGAAGCLGIGNPDGATSTTTGDGPDGTTSTTTGDGPGGSPSAGSEPPTGSGGPPVEGDWSVTFEDRFDAGSLDSEVWGLGFGPGNTELCEDYFASCIVEDQVWVDDETDRLVIETDDEPYEDVGYRTATVNTSPSFSQEFGYFEAKSRVPAQPGGQPAFWAWTDSGAGYYRTEIDFYEVFGTDATHPSFAMHVDCDGNDEAQHLGGRTELEEPTDDAFHVWGCLWTPEEVSFYVDGSRVYRFVDDLVEDCAPGDPVYAMLTTHVQPPGRHGDPAEASYPYRHEFEWVRAWQREQW